MVRQSLAVERQRSISLLVYSERVAVGGVRSRECAARVESNEWRAARFSLRLAMTSRSSPLLEGAATAAPLWPLVVSFETTTMSNGAVTFRRAWRTFVPLT